jgi:hypothetical protein
MVHDGPTRLGLSTNGVLSAEETPDWPAESVVQAGVDFDNGLRTGTYSVVVPTPLVATEITGITHNFQIDQYANFIATITVNDSYHSPINLASYTLTSSLKRSTESTTTTDFAITETDAANGKITMELTSDQTALLSKGTYYYDLVLTHDTTDDAIRALYGYARISEGVTR